MNYFINIVYSFFVFLAEKLLPVFAIFSTKARQYLIGQNEIESKLDEIKKWRLNNLKKEIIWFHCASLGEFEQGRPVLESFKIQNPNFAIVLTFFSPSGYEIRKNYTLADFVLYLPIDSKRNSENFVQAVNPKFAVFVKYEFWPNIIRATKKNQTILIGISVILRENQAFFKIWGGFFRKILFSFDHLFVQNEKSGNLLQGINYQNYSIVGDTRFDRVIVNAREFTEIAGIEKFVENKKVLVVGSAWKEDMEVLTPFIRKHAALKVIIAPHEMHDYEMNAWMQQLDAQRYSVYKNDQLKNSQVLIIDSIGLLSKLYQYATFAYVGGSFGKGLHNTLEAAVFGVPIFFGDRKFQKFQEAVDLIEIGVGFPISDFESLAEKFESLDAEKLARIKTIALAYVKQQSGATDKIINYLAKY